MSTSNLYRLNAEDCLRMAASTPDERDKPFWLALAQSWLRLSERSARNHLMSEFTASPLQENPSALRASSQS
jgi:hypothetical protein